MRQRMKGKKKDVLFISEFIADCVVAGKDTPQDIVRHAKNLIANCDEEIKRVESLRIKRSKLLDVIETFESTSKNHKPEEVKILSFIKIQNAKICGWICRSLADKAVKIDDLFCAEISKQDIIFAIKQLLEYKIISKVGDSFIRGELFEEYLQFVLKGCL